MNRKLLCGLVLIACTTLLAPGGATAQEKDAPRVEIGPLFTSISVNQSDFPGTETQIGFGGRATYNLNDHVALEAEGNFFPGKSIVTLTTGGRAVQGQFGVKAGRRFDKFGVFAKARPGFVSFGEVFTITGVESQTFAGEVFQTPVGELQRRTHFSADLGAVLEFYPSRRVLARFDVGDTLIRYGEHSEFPSVILPGVPTVVPVRPSKTQHNFQFSASVGFRFMDPDDGGGGGGTDPAPPSDGAPKFEVGVQFTSLSLRPPSQFFFGVGGAGSHHNPGFGGRLAYNLNDHVALEAEGNFFTTRDFANPSTGGYPYQGQFGVKAGKRFERFGVFAKARPGFVGFTDVRRFSGTPVAPEFRSRSRAYFSTDVGGVLELYPSRRVLTRFDFGDTVIRYGERQDFIFPLAPGGVGQVVTVPPKTRHNFQFSAGIGFRF